MRWSKTLTVVGCHAEGEVGHVVTGGVIDVPGGATMFEKEAGGLQNLLRQAGAAVLDGLALARTPKSPDVRGARRFADHPMILAMNI